MAERKVEDVWDAVWRPVLCSEVGLETEALDLNEVKRALYEYHLLRERVGNSLRNDDELENDIRGWRNVDPMDQGPNGL